MTHFDPIALTTGPQHHFFGYYDKSPWNPSMRWVLTHRVSETSNTPQPGNEVEVGLVDLENSGSFHALARTAAWNWQQGSMLQWFDERSIVFNARRDNQWVSVRLDIHNGKESIYDRPIYALSPDRRTALSLNFDRLHITRPGYGYASDTDAHRSMLPAPEDDGIFAMDLTDRRHKLLISLAQLAESAEWMGRGRTRHWVNHLQFNTIGDRFAFVHRSAVPNAGMSWSTRLMTSGIEGEILFVLQSREPVSHYDWRDGHSLLAWSRYRGDDGYVLFNDLMRDQQYVAPKVLTRDGHCSYSPDRQWLLTDTYPSADGKRDLLLYHFQSSQCFLLGRYHNPFPSDPAQRCDLHPRWSPDGRHVCFDSMHEGARQLYAGDISNLIESVAHTATAVGAAASEIYTCR